MRRFSSITTTQIARICGVSQGTVDRALNNRQGISQKTKAKILEVAREYEYVPNVKGGTKDKSMLIGVVLYDLYNEFFSKLAMSLVESAKKDGYSVIFLFSNKDLKAEKSAIDYFNYIGVDGIVLFSVGTDSVEYQNYLNTIKKPIVTVGNKLFEFAHVGIDDFKAMYDLTCAVLKKCDGEVSYFAPILKRNLNKNNAQELRLNGFKKATKEKGINYKIVLDEKDLDENVNAVICSTDYYMLNAINKFGINSNKVIAGFDNIPALKKLNLKTLTVEYSTNDIANECMNYFLRRKYTKNICHTIVCDN